MAMSVNANFGAYPLAFGMVESENQEFWKYFLKKLYEQFGKNKGFGLCFMTDRQNGVLNALDQIFPTMINGFVVGTYTQTLSKNFQGLL